jgi:hypothetical protein
VQRKSFILEEWKKRRIILEKRLRAKHVDYLSSNDASNNHKKDKLMKILSHSFKNQVDAMTKAQ